MSQEDFDQNAGDSSSDDSDLDILPPKKTSACTKATQRPKRAAEAVSYEALQVAGFDGGPSLMEVSIEIGRAREQRREEERVAAEKAAKKQAEEDAAEEAAREKRRRIKHQSPADSLQQEERVVTQGEARGAALRVQAAAHMESKYAFGQALEASTYAGAAKKEAERNQAREGLQMKRQRKD